MSGFFWQHGHIGWPLFALALYSLVWVLVFDLIWRLVRLKFVLLAGSAALAWVAGVALIVLGAAFWA